MKAYPIGTRIRKGNLTGRVVSKLARAGRVQEIRFDGVDHFLGGVEWWPPELIRKCLLVDGQPHVQFVREAQEGEKVTA